MSEAKICYICQRFKTEEQDKSGVPVCHRCQEEHDIKPKEREEEFNFPPLFSPAAKMPSITAPPPDECPLAFEPLDIDEMDLKEFDDDPTPVLGAVRTKQGSTPDALQKDKK